MELPNGAVVAVADGEQLLMFKNDGDEKAINLVNFTSPSVSGDNKSAGVRNQDGGPGGNDPRDLEESAHAAGVADWLNSQVLSHKVDKLVVIADPKSIGEMRRHYHKETQGALLGEITKTLTNSPVADIEKAIEAA